MIMLTATVQEILLIFIIAFIGYVIGSIQIKGIRLGVSGIFLVGMIFGHLGVKLSDVTQTIGLILSITAMGFSAGPGFIQRLRKNGFQYVCLCLSTATTGGLLCYFLIRFTEIEAPLAVGILTGAFTTSPGFAAAKEAVSAEAAIQVASGYGLIYPIGVIIKVLSIQVIPRIFHADFDLERQLITIDDSKPSNEQSKEGVCRIDKFGFSVFSLAVVLGLILGTVTVPLPGGGEFSLGPTGGSLVMGLLFSGVGQIGFLNLKIEKEIINPMKEIGLLLFFAGAGVEGGHGVENILMTHGIVPLIYGVILVLVPLLTGVLMFRYVLKLPMLNGLGSMAASMTCTPSLAVLIQVSGTDDVTSAYATTYPIALITLVILVQVLLHVSF